MLEHQAIIALGANLGDAHASIGLALERLSELPDTRLVQVSSFYSSSPVGGPAGQPQFINAVAELDTNLEPLELLDSLQRLEAELGRVRSETWSARRLDLDLLSYDSLVWNHPRLRLPHPRMTVRRFVMEPLVKILPAWQHPQLDWSASRVLDWLDNGPRSVKFSPCFRNQVAQMASSELFSKFELLTGGWQIVETEYIFMFEVFLQSEFLTTYDWKSPRFFPAVDDPNKALDQLIATCRGLTDSVFTV